MAISRDRDIRPHSRAEYPGAREMNLFFSATVYQYDLGYLSMLLDAAVSTLVPAPSVQQASSLKRKNWSRRTRR